MEKKDIVSYNYDELQDEIKSIGENRSVQNKFMHGFMKNWQKNSMR